MLSVAKWAGLSLAASLVFAGPARATEPLEFFTAYIAQLGGQEVARAATLAASQGSATEKLTGCVKTTQAFAMQLRADGAGLREMKLKGDLAEIVPALADLNDTRADLQTELSLICANMADGTHSPEEMAQMVAATPQIGDSIKQADHLVFEGVPQMAHALYPPGADVGKPGVRFAISRAQRDALVAEIDEKFPQTIKGKSLEELKHNTNDSYAVASVALLKVYLLQGKASDDP